MDAAEFVMALVSGGVGFVAADALDRFLATYNPGGSTPPKDKFTSTGTGALANTMNIAARPGLMRIGAGVGIAAVPAVGAMFTRSPMLKSSLEGMALGAGISLFKTLWNNLLMPLLTPKDTSVPSLQKSIIVRLYPAETTTAINVKQGMNQQGAAVSSGGSGVLSGPDVGPYALAGSSEYPDAAQALRQRTGVSEQYPSVQNTWGTSGTSEYQTAAQALRQQAGMSAPADGAPWQPGPPSDIGPGPQAKPHTDPACGCIGDPTTMYSAFLGDAQEEPLISR